jgi:hypothetical protein
MRDESLLLAFSQEAAIDPASIGHAHTLITGMAD